MSEYYIIGSAAAAIIMAAAILVFKLRHKVLRVKVVMMPGGKLKLKREDIRHYKFSNGLKCTQKPMELWQHEKLAELLAELEIDENADITLDTLNTAFFRKRGLRRFAQIALIDQARFNEKAPDVSIDLEELARLTEDELEEVQQDFFTLNPKMIKRFGFLKNVLVLHQVREMILQDTADGAKEQKSMKSNAGN